MFFQLEKTETECTGRFSTVPSFTGISWFSSIQKAFWHRKMEKDDGFPQNGRTACKRNTSVSLHQQKGAVWQDNQDIQPEGHENTSSSNFSFACSSLEEVQQKFSHVKGWAVKRQAGLWLNTGQDKPTTFWAKLSAAINSRGLFVFGYKGHIFHYSPIHCSE